jgi:hypothetical protein
MARSPHPASIAATAAALAVALLLGGCWSSKPAVADGSGTIVTSDTPVPTSAASVDPTTPAEPQPTDSTRISHPISGSKTRAELLDSARKKLGSGSSFYVHQLWVQGNKAAVGDLQETSGQGRRLFFVWVGPPWQAVWYTLVGDGASTQQRAMHGVPELTSELANKIDWSVVKAPGKGTVEASFASAVQQWTGQVMNGKGKPYKVTLIRVAESSSGAWWGRAVVQPTGNATNQYEPIEYWAKYVNGAWTGKAQDPEPPSPTTYFPAGVTVTLFK